jgi:hypothetical protein
MTSFNPANPYFSWRSFNAKHAFGGGAKNRKDYFH